MLRPVLLTLLAGAFAPSIARTLFRWRPSNTEGELEAGGARRWIGACAEHPARLGLAAALAVLAIDLPGRASPAADPERGGAG